MTNLYCRSARIDVPSLAGVKGHREAGPYSLLLVALLEAGGPLTLDEVADRFARAGIASSEKALKSLKRCRPARPPVYREGDLYHLDPHDDELHLWLFRLDLRPPSAPALKVVQPEPAPLPGPKVALKPGEIQEAFRHRNLRAWSSQRLALAVLDAHGPRLEPGRVMQILDELTDDHGLRLTVDFNRRGGAVRAQADGTWEMDAGHAALPSARRAVREQLTRARRDKERGQDPVQIKARAKDNERRAAARAVQLARLRRVLVYGYPAGKPRAVVLLDIGRRELQTFFEADFAAVRERLAGYDYIAGLGVRALLRALEFDSGERRLGELGPPQKTVKLNRAGRTLTLTPELLIQGSCGIGKPFGDPRKTAAYLEKGETGRLKRRLESDAKSLFALYSYGMLHHVVRLTWGFLDMHFPAHWAHVDEPGLRGILREAFRTGRDLEVVAGSAPGWKNPWARARRCRVYGDERSYRYMLADEDGRAIFDDEVQLVRFVEP